MNKRRLALVLAASCFWSAAERQLSFPSGGLFDVFKVVVFAVGFPIAGTQ